ncbi:MAG: glycosyltransferase family 39 protein [Candidatus Adiutrix sp.]|jgi:hypothetical protein|nr:glycosyltransferase family 39 protein [Candidatus Adiutrix sp.]
MNIPALKKMSPWFGLALIAAWPLLIANRGFDVSDTGFYLAGYRYVFSHPEVAPLSTLLSSWLGGLIYAALPYGQLLALKLTCVLIYAAIAYWTFRMLRGHFPDWLILIGLACASIHATTYIYVAGYNTFSYLFLSAALYLLYRALERDRLSCLLAAGALLGLNIFIRLPNILHCAAAAVPLWHYWFCLGQRRKGLKRAAQFSLAYLGAVAAFCGLVWLARGPEPFIQAFGYLGAVSGAAGTGLDSHNFLTLWEMFLNNIQTGLEAAGLYVPGLLLGSLALMGLMGAWPGFGLMKTVIAVGGPALAFLGGLAAGDPYSFLYPFQAATAPLIALAGLLYYHRKNPLLSDISGMIIVVALAMPLGSDFGARHYAYYWHLALAGALGLTCRLWLEAASRLERKRPGAVGGKAALAANLTLWFMVGLQLPQLTGLEMRTSFMDLPYSRTTAAVEGVGPLAGMKTNPVRAVKLAQIARELKPLADMKMVVMGQAPICFLLSDAEPFFDDLWIDLHNTPAEAFAAELERGVALNRPPLILALDGSADPGGRRWISFHKWRLLRFFIKKYNYVLHVDDVYYKLYLPPERVFQAGGRRPAAL